MAHLTLEQLNAAPYDVACAMLDGLYEHSLWIAEQALASRPFRSVAHFKHGMAEVLRAASQEQQRAHHPMSVMELI